MPQKWIKTKGTVCFVDDEENYLESMKLFFSSKFPVITFLSPLQAAVRLREDNQYLIEEERLLAEVTSTEEPPLLFKRALIWLAENERHNIVETCFSDYDMPAMTGAKLLGQLENPRIRRVLLTGQADARDAVAAFNAGAIDAYLPKQSTEMLKTATLQAEKGAKRELDVIWRTMDDDLRSALAEQSTVEAVSHKLDSIGAEEYILLPKPAGFLCRCFDDTFKWAQLETHTSQVGAVEILRDEGVTQDVLETLISGQQAAGIELSQAFEGLAPEQSYPYSSIDVVRSDPWIGMAVFDLPASICQMVLG